MIAATVLLAVIVPVAAAASTAPSSTDTLDLPAAEARAANPPATAAGVYRLDGESLRRFATLEDALASLPGFRVRRQGGLGGYSELSFRGARATSVEVYVDGARLNQDGDGAPDLSKWPSLWFSSLEARTGFDAAAAGSAGPGSLARIDLSTRTEHAAEVHARGGSFGTGEAAAQVQTRGGQRGTDWRWTLGVEGQAARNDYPVFSDNGTVYNTDDDATWNMDNNAYQSRGARAAARHADGAGSQTFSILWLESRKEYPGIFPSSSHAYATRTDWLGAWRLSHLEGRVTWETGAQARRFEDSYRDPDQTLGYLSHEAARLSHAVEGDARVQADLFSRPRSLLLSRLLSRLTARADTRVRGEESESVATPYSRPHATPDARRGEVQFGAALDAGFAEGASATVEARQSLVRFRADGLRAQSDTATARIASVDSRPVALRGAVQWKSTTSQSLSMIARLEQRAPASGELLGDNLGIRAKLDLRPEETRGVSLVHEAAASLRGAAPWTIGAQSTAFWNDYRDPIRLKAHGASAFMRHENDADYRALGTETLITLNSPLAEASASVTWQDASIAEGLYKGNRPAHESAVESHAEAFVKPFPGIRLGMLADFRGPYHPGAANIPDARRDAEWELAAHAGLARGPARLALDVRNLFDQRYRDFVYSPRSGRSWSLTVSANL
jgi:outer membrane cobalamin receptor